MKILFLGGNMAKGLSDWLRQQGETVLYREDIITIDDLEQTSPDFIISYNYRYIITKEIIEFVKGKVINLHIAYLPWNKGAYPNIWSFLEDTPKGVTIHYVDEGLDTGDIIVQKEVFIDEDKETLKSSYEILHREMQELFKKNWEKIKTGQYKSQKTDGGASTLRGGLQPLNPSLEKKDGIPQSESLKKNIDFGDVILKNFINFTAEERETILTWRNYKEIRRWMYSDHVISPDEHLRFMERLKDDGKNFYWLAEHKNKGDTGVISLNRVDFNNKNAYLGIYSNPEISGAGNLFIDCLKHIAFNVADLHTLKAEVIETNERAINFYKKSGFSEEGRLKEFVFKDGRWQDVIVMGTVNVY